MNTQIPIYSDTRLPRNSKRLRRAFRHVTERIRDEDGLELLQETTLPMSELLSKYVSPENRETASAIALLTFSFHGNPDKAFFRRKFGPDITDGLAHIINIMESSDDTGGLPDDTQTLPAPVRCFLLVQALVQLEEEIEDCETNNLALDKDALGQTMMQLRYLMPTDPKLDVYAVCQLRAAAMDYDIAMEFFVGADQKVGMATTYRPACPRPRPVQAPPVEKLWLN